MRFIADAYVSLYSFISSATLPVCMYFGIIRFLPVNPLPAFGAATILSCSIVNLSFSMFLKKTAMQVVLRATFLGTVFAAGIYISFLSHYDWRVFGWYVCVLSFFHYSEYLSIAVTNPKTLTLDAFMLNHSLAYGAAASGSWIEFFVEYYFVSGVKRYYWISICGLTLCIMGELLRKSAMFTASTNFNHIVQTVKDNDHVLVTHGVYSLCRHPSYVGWFYWSIGTQLILVNPVCIVIYTAASWSFFRERLLVEEEALINFFGEDYIKYKKRVHSGLLCNDGIQLEE